MVLLRDLYCICSVPGHSQYRSAVVWLSAVAGSGIRL
jgi:hypothetical protein